MSPPLRHRRDSLAGAHVANHSAENLRGPVAPGSRSGAPPRKDHHPWTAGVAGRPGRSAAPIRVIGSKHWETLSEWGVAAWGAPPAANRAAKGH